MRILIPILAFLAMAAVIACGPASNPESNENNPDGDPAATATATPTETPKDDGDPTKEPEPTETPKPSGNLIKNRNHRLSPRDTQTIRRALRLYPRPHMSQCPRQHQESNHHPRTATCKHLTLMVWRDANHGTFFRLQRMIINTSSGVGMHSIKM